MGYFYALLSAALSGRAYWGDGFFACLRGFAIRGGDVHIHMLPSLRLGFRVVCFEERRMEMKGVQDDSRREGIWKQGF